MLETAEKNATSALVKSDMAPAKPIRLLDQVRNRICVKHYSRSTEKTYIYWIRFYIHFHGLRHPQDMGAPEVEGNPTSPRTCRAIPNCCRCAHILDAAHLAGLGGRQGANARGIMGTIPHQNLLPA